MDWERPDREEVRRLAHLARILVDDSSLDTMTSSLERFSDDAASVVLKSGDSPAQHERPSVALHDRSGSPVCDAKAILALAPRTDHGLVRTTLALVREDDEAPETS